jgi:acetate kinase
MRILVLNAGSSSVKFQVFDTVKDVCLIKGKVDGIGLATSSFTYNILPHILYKSKEKDAAIHGHLDKPHTIEHHFMISTHQDAVAHILHTVESQYGLHSIDAVGHRVVHGGELYKKPVLITDAVTQHIDDLSSMAPLHNPANLAGIKACSKLLPHIKQVAVFDTAFHQSMPRHAFLYAIPIELYDQFKIRKYGFHGISHEYIALQAKRILRTQNCNIVSCHLGNGSSITAIENGKSIDTSMGFTPLQGLIMGTRSGNIDPEVVVFLAKALNTTEDEIVRILNEESGLKGLCGYSDVRTIHELAVKGDKLCQFALDMLAYKLIKHIGSYMAVLPSVDAVVFTAGIGEGAFYIRKKVCDGLRHFGLKIDDQKNRKNTVMDITGKGSKIKILVIPTNEEWMIAQETVKILNAN